MAKNQEDAELNAMLARMATDGTLADRLAELLADADWPQLELNGVEVALQKPPTADKSCYKKCLKDCLDPNKGPDCYKNCIKKCKKAVVSLNLDGLVLRAEVP